MIENYLEENPNDARIIVQKSSCSVRVTPLKKRVKWSNVKP
jgi:hypothetical protein